MKQTMRLTHCRILLASILISSCTLSAFAQVLKPVQKSDPARAVAPELASPIPQEPVGTKLGDILLSYPRGENNNIIESASTFLVGAVPPGRHVSCNGNAITVNADGYFAHLVKLNYGKNNFSLTLSGQEDRPLTLCVSRPAPAPTLSASSFNILPESLEPAEALGVSPGDIVQFAARATPACQLSVQIGGHHILLKPAVSKKKGKGAVVNLGLDTAFGVSFQRTPAAVKDLYLGFYKIQAADNWKKAAPVFLLQKGKKTITASSRGVITVMAQPQLLETAHSNTIVRLGPGAARTTPLPQSVRLLADGFKGEWWRFELCPNRHVWIAREDMQEDDGRALPQSKVSTVNLGTDSYGARIAVPLNQRLPYQIEQDPSSKKLLLRIFGATANTDFVTSDLHPSDSASARLIDYVSWRQKSDLQYELLVQLNHKQQWGFFADYEDKTLVLHLKSAPAISPAASSLKGAIICVDPGHGGKEIGSVGCSGVKEANVNFAIADKLRQQLEAMGASVVMTRKGDNFVSLQDRVDMAVAARADLLVSVHNNALPDGADPLQEHGTSSYWYHPQSLELAGLAQKQLVQESKLKDFGCRYQNLALCRPSQMPAILMEIGFMINPDELSSLLNPHFQELAARSIAASIKKFFIEKTKLEQPADSPTASGKSPD